MNMTAPQAILLSEDDDEEEQEIDEQQAIIRSNADELGIPAELPGRHLPKSRHRRQDDDEQQAVTLKREPNASVAHLLDDEDDCGHEGHSGAFVPSGAVDRALFHRRGTVRRGNRSEARLGCRTPQCPATAYAELNDNGQETGRFRMTRLHNPLAHQQQEAEPQRPQLAPEVRQRIIELYSDRRFDSSQIRNQLAVDFGLSVPKTQIKSVLDMHRRDRADLTERMRRARGVQNLALAHNGEPGLFVYIASNTLLDEILKLQAQGVV